jgi:TolB-like protein/predicted Zn-dependent protease
MRTFVQELKKRRVYRVALAYAVAGSAIVQVVGTVLPAFHAPDWMQQVFLILIALGFPLALVLAWGFDIEDGVIKKTRLRGRPPASSKHRVWIVGAVGFLIAAAGVGAYWALHPWQVAKPVDQKAAAQAPELDIPEKSIAVLPFENLHDGTQDFHLSEGMQDEILTDLAKVAGLKVISRTSVMQYKTGVEHNLRMIARDLGVAHVLEGSVQVANNRVRVSAQLIDARTDTHVWAERYDRDLADVFALQSELAEKIVSQLKTKLSPAEKAAIEEPPTVDLAAYDPYEHAKTLITNAVLNEPRKENLLEAIKLLNEAVARDPSFFLAYYQLAHAHDQIYFLGFDRTPERLALADAAVQSVRRLRPDSGEAHLALAKHLYWGYLDYDRAREELTSARRALPGDSFPLLLAGYLDRRQGHWEDSIRNMQRALELDPRNFLILQQLSLTFENLRRYADEAATLDRALKLAPNDIVIRTQRAAVDFVWRADTKPLDSTIQAIVAKEPKAAKLVADQWIVIALCEQDTDGAARAVSAMTPDGCGSSGVPFPRAWCEGLAARARGDAVKATAAFTAARAEMEKIVRDQPNYAGAFCALGMIDAALGRKKDAVQEGRRAVELLPVTKDAVDGAQFVQYLAVIYAWTGKKDRALEQLSDAAKLPGYLSYGQLRLHPYWDPLRDDSRFQKIVASLAPK